MSDKNRKPYWGWQPWIRWFLPLPILVRLSKRRFISFVWYQDGTSCSPVFFEALACFLRRVDKAAEKRGYHRGYEDGRNDTLHSISTMGTPTITNR